MSRWSFGPRLWFSRSGLFFFFFPILHEVELFWFILKYRRLKRLVALLEP